MNRGSSRAGMIPTPGTLRSTYMSITSARSAAALPKAMFMSSCRIWISSSETTSSGSGAIGQPQSRLGPGQDCAHGLLAGRLLQDLHRPELERPLEGLRLHVGGHHD